MSGRGVVARGLLALSMVPFAMGARGGCGPIDSTDPAPDVEGEWQVAYGSDLAVRVNIGGSVYEATLPAEGGTFMVDHGGFQIPFTIDCSLPEVVCPQEAWPDMVSVSQREPTYPHRMWVTIPQQSCSGSMHMPSEAAGECGAETNNPDCEVVCDGEVVTSSVDTFGLINEPGDHFNLLLGAGFASNGVNCALLAVSAANADIMSSGAAETEDWTAEAFTSGEVVTAVAGGCLWAEYSEEDMELNALVLGASIEVRASFEATRAP
ncbi:MAG: hypothetical protein AB7S26_00630 [Sandaracinaceae bacterium]